MRINKTTFTAVILSVLAFASTVPFLARAAPALPEALDVAKNKYTFDGEINAAVTDGETLYIGGSFSTVSRGAASEAALMDTATGNIDANFPKFRRVGVVDETVYAVIPDGAGGWYVGGSFNKVDGADSPSLVRVDADGAPNDVFDVTGNISISSGGGVYALALSPDGNTLYVGGSFVAGGDLGIRDFVALDAETGDLSPVSFDVTIGCNSVHALALSPDGETIYLGGECMDTGELTSRNLLAFDTGTGAGLAFDPHPDGGVYALTLSPDGGTLYAGGSFINIGGAAREELAAIDAATGLAEEFSFSMQSVNCGDTVRSLALSSDGGTLYVGASDCMIDVNGLGARSLAAFSATDGSALDFDPNPNGPVYALSLSADGATLYAGGSFGCVGNLDGEECLGVLRDNFAAINTTTGLPASSAPEANDIVYAISENVGGKIVIGGSHTFVGTTVTRKEVAAIDLDTYELADFDPDVVPHNETTTYALALSPDGNTLYIGGNIDGVNGGDALRSYLAAVDTGTAIANAFNPSLGGIVRALDVSSDGEIVYAGGGFTIVNGGDAERDYVAAFNAADGTVTQFDPGVTLDDEVYALTLSPDDTKVYVGGLFTGRIASLDAADGTLLDNPIVPPNDVVNALALSSDGATLYVGGNFTQFSLGAVTTTIGEGAPFNAATGDIADTYPLIETRQEIGQTIYTSIPDGLGGWYIGGSFTHVDGVAQGGVAHILPDGTLDANFGPSIDTISGDEVYALALSSNGGILYVGGYFGSSGVNGTTRNGLAALDTADGSLIAGFDPNLNSGVDGGPGYASSIVLSSDGATLYAGGGFDCVGDLDVDFSCLGDVRNNIASFYTSNGAIVPEFDPNVDAPVKGLALSSDDATVYAVGSFTAVNASLETRNGVAAFATSGAVTAFDIGLTDFSGLGPLALSSDDAVLYVGGYYLSTDGGFTAFTLGGFNTNDGTSSGFRENFLFISGEDFGILYALALSPDDSILYVGGEFDCSALGDLEAVTCDQARSNFAAITVSDGALTDFAPSFDAAVRTISEPQDGEVYIGGSFTALTEISLDDIYDRAGLAAIDTSDFSITDFTTEIETGDGVYALALTSDDEILYVGGDCIDYDEEATCLGYLLESLDANTGEALAFSPEMDGLVSALSLSPDNAELYAGGAFTNRLAIYSSETEEAPAATPSRTPGQGFAAPRKALQDQIDYLLKLIAELKAKLGLLPGNAPSGSGSAIFTRNLTIGSVGEDVKALQVYLNTHGFVLAPSGPGSPGHETNLFGPLTRAALARFQAAKGISPAAGYFGPLTRAYVNAHP